MRLSVFSNSKDYAEYLITQANLIEDNGLRIASQNLKNAKQGWGRDEFLKWNNIPEEKAEQEWEHHIEWLEDQVNFLKKKIKTLRNKAEKALRS